MTLLARRSSVAAQWLVLGGLLVGGAAFGQAQAPPAPGNRVPLPQLPPLGLVDMPTAGILERSTYEAELRAFDQGGVILRMRLGVSDHFQVGVSYGGRRILGEGSPEWYERPELQAKLRLVDETVRSPALAIGVESQGVGPYSESAERYQFKAPGLFMVLSKSYAFLSGFGLHGGVTYNPLEGSEDRGRPDLFVGVDVSLREGVYFLAEYDAAFDDHDSDVFPLRHGGRGYLNVGLGAEFSEGQGVSLEFRDLLGRALGAEASRELRINVRGSL